MVVVIVVVIVIVVIVSPCSPRSSQVIIEAPRFASIRICQPAGAFRY